MELFPKAPLVRFPFFWCLVSGVFFTAVVSRESFRVGNPSPSQLQLQLANRNRVRPRFCPQPRPSVSLVLERSFLYHMDIRL